MGFAFTPYALIAGTLTFFSMYLIWYGIKSGKTWISVCVALLSVVLFVFKPIKLTTGTAQHNAIVDNRVMQQHTQQLNQLPPRIKVNDESYDDYLSSQTKKLTNKESK